MNIRSSLSSDIPKINFTKKNVGVKENRCSSWDPNNIPIRILINKLNRV